MNINLDYGNSKLEVDISDKNLLYIIENRSDEALPDPKEKLIESLKRPIGTLPLEEKIKDKSKVCIVISDITRAVPTKLILEALLPELLSYGVNKDSITILIATGLHRPNEGEELVRLVGKDIAENYNIVNHNAKDRENCRQIGETKGGTPIILNKVFLDSDFKILTGLIEPHFIAGFSGGRKAICPGISYIDMFRHFHGPKILESPNAPNAILFGNPFHEESTEIAKKAGVDFIVNVTINKNKEVTGIFSGDLERAFLAGAEFCLKANTYSISKEADIVVTSGGGFPLDINLYQAVKGMVGALPAVKKGGMIIIASLNAFSAPGGPIEITIALPPCSSFNWIPTSIAYRSRGFIMLSTPSLIIVPVFSSIFTLLVSGTCLIGIIMFNFSPSTVVFISLYNSSYKNMSYG